MALILGDRVRETSATVGTGSIVLGGAVSGHQPFSAILANGDTTYYAIVQGDQWETGLGTLTDPSTLARTTVLDSSSSGAKISFSTGTKDVFVTAPGAILQRLVEMPRLPSGTDLNTVLEPGTYAISVSAGTANSPETSATNSVLTVETKVEGSIKRVWQVFKGSLLWYRSIQIYDGTGDTDNFGTWRGIPPIAATAASILGSFASTTTNSAVAPSAIAAADVYFKASVSGTYAPSISTSSRNLELTLTGNLTLGAFQNIREGLDVTIDFVQGTTARTLSAVLSAHEFPGGAVPALTATAGRRDRLIGKVVDRSGTLKMSWHSIFRDIR